jgi:hypothetical protein
LLSAACASRKYADSSRLKDLELDVVAQLVQLVEDGNLLLVVVNVVEADHSLENVDGDDVLALALTHNHVSGHACVSLYANHDKNTLLDIIQEHICFF